MMIEILITKKNTASRIDRWFKQYGTHVPYGLVQKWCRKGNIKLNGKKAKADAAVNEGDILSFPEVKLKEHKSVISDASLEQFQKAIIHEDNELMVLNKPYGIATQGGNKVRVSIDDYLEAYSQLKDKKYRLVHRLDKNTTGVLLIAVTHEMAVKLGDEFKKRRVNKTYRAIVHGEVKEDYETIDQPIGEITTYKNKKMAVVKDGVEAVTHYEVLARNPEFSYLELKPITGRKHQLRVHLSHIGHPILGDHKYGDFNDDDKLHLHCMEMETLGQSFYADPPEHFLE